MQYWYCSHFTSTGTALLTHNLATTGTGTSLVTQKSKDVKGKKRMFSHLM